MHVDRKAWFCKLFAWHNFTPESTGGSFRNHCFFHTRKFCCDVLRYDVPFSSPREVLNHPLCPRVVVENPVLLNIMVCQCNSTLADHRSLDDESWMDMMQVARSLEPCLVRFRVAQARGVISRAGTAKSKSRVGTAKSISRKRTASDVD